MSVKAADTVTVGGWATVSVTRCETLQEAKMLTPETTRKVRAMSARQHGTVHKVAGERPLGAPGGEVLQRAAAVDRKFWPTALQGLAYCIARSGLLHCKVWPTALQGLAYCIVRPGPLPYKVWPTALQGLAYCLARSGLLPCKVWPTAL